MSLNDIANMPTSEKIYLMEALWSSLCMQEEKPQSPSWHKELLDIRFKKFQTEEVKLYSLDELRALR
jgi:hypothetical protein